MELNKFSAHHKLKVAQMVTQYLRKHKILTTDLIPQVEVRFIEQVICTEDTSQQSVISTEVDQIFSMLVSNLPFRWQRKSILNMLQNASVITVGQLCRTRNEDDLLKFRNFGRKRLNCLKDQLEEVHVSIGKHAGQPPGPKELSILKGRSISDFPVSSDVLDLLRTLGVSRVSNLFPRREFEERVATSELNDEYVRKLPLAVAEGFAKDLIEWT